jgi:hypothetical protein
MHVWSQATAAALAAIAFVAALMPDPSATELPVRRLIRFPGVWAGLAILAYVTVQALNPSWRYQSSESLWWLEPLDHVAWIPAPRPHNQIKHYAL